MKKFLTIVGIVLALIIIFATSMFFYIKSMKLPEINIGTVNNSKLNDGTYTGDYSAGLVKVSLKVTIDNKTIKDIIIIKHENGLGKKAEVIKDMIINKQTIDVDSISGATLSSECILKAVEIALKESINK